MLRVVGLGFSIRRLVRREISRSSETLSPQKGGPRLCRWILTVTVRPTSSPTTPRLVGLAFSIGTGTAGDQQVVRDVVAATGWTAIVPMDIDGHGRTDLVSDNAVTGRAAFSIGTGTVGDQQVVRDVVAATGWSSIVPMDIDGHGPTDLVSYNAVTGRAAFSVGTGTAGDQQVVRDVVAATGWTADCADGYRWSRSNRPGLL